MGTDNRRTVPGGTMGVITRAKVGFDSPVVLPLSVLIYTRRCTMHSQTPRETLAKAKKLLTAQEVYWRRRVAQREAIEAYLRRTGDVK